MSKEEHGGAVGRKTHRRFPIHTGHRYTQGARRRQIELASLCARRKRRSIIVTRIADRNSTRSAPEIVARSLCQIQTQTDGSKAYCTQKMVLTMGSTLDY
jgi:hypothetical protein